VKKVRNFRAWLAAEEGIQSGKLPILAGLLDSSLAEAGHSPFLDGCCQKLWSRINLRRNGIKIEKGLAPET
jgi:hypothetical protein